MSDTRFLLDQIAFARRYTVDLLEGFDPADWFRMPTPAVTHMAWQVGHLAFAQYRLALERVRGIQPEDGALISRDFLTQFAIQSTPTPDPARYPSPAEIRGVFDRVHERVQTDLQGLSDIDLEAPATPPHRLGKTRREVLLWLIHHEMLHAGQIGLLRRLLGMDPKR